jgi:hypothetical protein
VKGERREIDIGAAREKIEKLADKCGSGRDTKITE